MVQRWELHGDAALYTINFICFVLFLVEWPMQMLGKPRYMWGFFFWLDFISTVSLLLDISTLNESLFGSSEDDPGSGARLS